LSAAGTNQRLWGHAVVDIDEVISGAKRPERTLELCLRPDLAAKLEDVQRRYAEEKDRPRESLADGGNLGALADELKAIKAEAAEHTIVFRFRSLNHYRIQTLARDLPPRDGVPMDKRLGYNVDALTWNLFRECCYEPDLTDEQVERLIGPKDRVGDGVLSPSQWKRLDETLDAVNFAARDIPF